MEGPFMRRDFHNWYSSRLNRNMELLVFGEGGLPVLVFPTSHGRFFEYENSGMVHALAQRIEERRVQLFCVDSVNSESWYNRSVHPRVRVMRHMDYESYLIHEVAPLMKQLSNQQQICTTGCSFGGYHALNFALKHPDLTSGCVAMSGAFDLRRFMDGYYDNDFYLNNPVDYVPNLTDRWFLERYQKMRIVLAAGDHDICLGENFKMAEALGKKGIPHLLDVWTGGERHDWPLWQRMAQKFF
jgi:esterase/lipase superfamily enzyme